MPKCFFFDVDGTLLPFGKSIPDSAVYSIKAAQALGSRCFIASGRSIAELPRFPMLAFDGYICSAGATIIVDDKLIYSAHIERGAFDSLFRYLSEKGFYVISQTDKATYLSKDAWDMFTRQLMKHIGRLVELNGLVISDTVPGDEDVKKVLFLSDDDGYGVDRVRKEIDPMFTVVNNTVGLPQEIMAEIVLGGISKATGIEKITVQTVVEAFMESVKDSLSKGNPVYLRGFGSFIIKHRAEKAARNIKQKTTLTIPAHDIPAFKPAKVFMNIVKK